MTERPDGAPAQAQPQDQPSATPAWPGQEPGPESPPQPPVQSQPPVQPQPPFQSQPQPQGPPSAYPYPSPQSPAGYGPPVAPIPTQQNPYGQPPGGYPPGYPSAPATPGSGAAGRAVLWAALGAVVASAAWAGGVFLLKGDETQADLRGYEAKSNLCSSVDYSSFKTEYPEEDTAPLNNSLEHEALDESYCSLSLKTSSTSSYSDAYFSVEVRLHHKTDPAPEFTAVWSEYDQRYDDYDVEKITGLGDEAYVVTEDTTSGAGTSGNRAAILAVRDGWMTYEMNWSAYASSYDEDEVELPEVDEVVEWLKTDTESTLENLRSADGI